MHANPAWTWWNDHFMRPPSRPIKQGMDRTLTVGLVSAIRVAAGFSQEGLAREIGVSFPTVNSWERGRSTPRRTHLDALRSLAESLGIRTDLMVLAIDDDPIACSVIEGFVVGSEIPADIKTTTDPSKGLILCGVLDPDLLLIDVMMPGIDGFELAERLNDIGRDHSPYVVFVTAFDAPDVRGRAEELGHAVIRKPLRQKDIDELLALVSTGGHLATA